MYKLGSRSKANLVGVEPLLAACATLTITRYLRVSDATIFEGVRSPEKQQYYYERGVSKTLNSDHLKGRAVDIVPYIDGQPRWDGKSGTGVHDEELQIKVDAAFEEIAVGMHKAAKALGIKVYNLHEQSGWDKPHWWVEGYYDIRKLRHSL